MPFPLPQSADESIGWCRECGGPVTARDPSVRTERPMPEYGGNWRDEGLLAYKQSRLVCGGCRLAREGSDRSWSHPPKGGAILAYPGTALRLPLFEALERLACRKADVPFALVVGNPRQRNPGHIYRFVPVNWAYGPRIDAYRARQDAYRPLSFRLEAVLGFLRRWLAGRPGTGPAGEGERRKFEQAAAAEHLMPSERLVAWLAAAGVSAPAEQILKEED